MPHTKLLLKDFHAVPETLKHKDEITAYRLQKLLDHYKYIADNNIKCDVNQLIIAYLSFLGNPAYPARLCDFFAYYGEYKLVEYLVKFHSAVIDQQVMDCALGGGDEQTIQFLHRTQPGLNSDISFINLPVMNDSVSYIVRNLDLSAYFNFRKQNLKFSHYKEALIDHLILQLQSRRVSACLKALKGLIHVTRQLTNDDKQKIVGRISNINFDSNSKKSFHFEESPDNIITYDNKAKVLAEYISLPTDDEIPSEPKEDDRSFVPSYLIQQYYLKLLHQLGCVTQYYETFYDSLDERDLTVPDKLNFTLRSMSDRDESSQSGSAVVYNQSEITQFQQEIQKRLYSNHYTNDKFGIEKKKLDIHNLVIMLSISFKDQHNKTYLIDLVKYLIKILWPDQKIDSVDFYFEQLSYLLLLLSTEELLTIVWPKFETMLAFSLSAWPIWPVTIHTLLSGNNEEQHDERTIYYAQGLISLFFDVFLPKLSQLQIQQLIDETSRFDQSPEHVNLAHYVSIALMVYWDPQNNTPEKLANLARKIFFILKFHKDICYEEPLINSDILLNVIFYRLSIKNRLNQLVPHLLRCIDHSDEMIEISLQLINLIIKYATKKDRVYYLAAHEQADSQPLNPFIATIAKFYENANELDYDGGSNAHIIEDIRFENEFLIQLLPSNVLADKALYNIWSKMFALSDPEFATEISTLLAIFGLRYPTGIIIDFIVDQADIIFDKLKDLFNSLAKGSTIYRVFHIIDLILQRLNNDELNHQKFINMIEILVKKTLSLNYGNFKLTIMAKLFPFGSSQAQDYILKCIAFYSTRLHKILDNTAASNFTTIRDIINPLALLAPCFTESNHELFDAVCKLRPIVLQNISGNVFTITQSHVLLTQFSTLLSAKVSSKNKSDLFQLVCDIFLKLIEQFRKNFKDTDDYHKDYKNTLYLFLNLLNDSNDVECFKRYFLPVYSQLFEYLQDDLTEFLYYKLHNGKYNRDTKIVGYSLLFTMVEFQQALHDLLMSEPEITAKQLTFCFMLLDFDKTRCIEFLGLKEGDIAIAILDMLAENHVSLIANSKPTQQIAHDTSQAVADEPMRDASQLVVMLIDSGNSMFSGTTKRLATENGSDEDEPKKLKSQRTGSPSKPR